jgi:hypothetical protein
VVRSRWPGPKLKVSLRYPSGELTTLADGTPARYYRLRVTNGRKWSPAHNVRVLLTNVFQAESNGLWVDRSLNVPLQLTWQFPDIHERYPFIGHDGVSDLGRIVKGQQFCLTPYVIPNDFNYFVGPHQTVRVKVMAVADNGKSEPALVEITWNGNWSDDAEEMHRHLVVAEVTGRSGFRANRPHTGLISGFPLQRGIIEQGCESPEFEGSQFRCVHCSAWGSQYWFGLYVHHPPEVSTRFKVSLCRHCGKRTYWYDGRMINPARALPESAREAVEKRGYMRLHPTTTG